VTQIVEDALPTRRVTGVFSSKISRAARAPRHVSSYWHLRARRRRGRVHKMRTATVFSLPSCGFPLQAYALPFLTPLGRGRSTRAATFRAQRR
jgi:hypothetical protein